MTKNDPSNDITRSSCTYAASPNVECQCGNREQVTVAHGAGLSFGKYRAFLELRALDLEITVDEIRCMTMRQIRNLMEELTGISSNEPFGNGGGHGAGSGSGQYHGGY